MTCQKSLECQRGIETGQLVLESALFSLALGDSTS